ncbi:MAG: TspO/MBR family protein [Thermaurantiacus sp.]
MSIETRLASAWSAPADAVRRLPGWALVLAAILTLNGLGGVSALIGDPPPQNAWYQALTLPAWQPPGWAFGLAWTLLYSLLGLVLARVLMAPASPGQRQALALFAFQFGLNLAWSPLFFAAQAIVPALALLAVLWLAAIAATLAVARVERWLAWAMVPYLVWLSYAALLNWRLAVLNPGA